MSIHLAFGLQLVEVAAQAVSAQVHFAGEDGQGDPVAFVAQLHDAFALAFAVFARARFIRPAVVGGWRFLDDAQPAFGQGGHAAKEEIGEHG